MGNTHTIVQTVPHIVRGAILTVENEAVISFFSDEGSPSYYHYNDSEGRQFYIHLEIDKSRISFPNLDCKDTEISLSKRTYIYIQSGGKMWCGYESFVKIIDKLARYVSDSEFYIGDENDFIDKYVIENGALNYERVHSGSWYDVDKYLAENGTSIRDYI